MVPGEVDNRSYHARVSFDESTVEVGEAEESPNVVEVDKGHPVYDGVTLRGVHHEVILCDDQFTRVHRGLLPFVFLDLEVKTVRGKYLADLGNMNLRFLKGSAVDQNVVKVSRAEFMKEGLQEVVDEMLQVCGGVGESKGHNQGFEESIYSTKPCLLFLPLWHANKLGSPWQVESCVILRLGPLVHCFADERQRVAVFDGSLVEPTIIDTKAQGPVLFLYEQDGGASWGRRCAAKSFRQVFLQPFLTGLQLVPG